MASAGDIHSILYKGDILQPKEPSYDASKRVIRYFPGQVPDYACSNNEDVFDETQENVKVNAQECTTSPKTSVQVKSDSPPQTIHERRLRLLKDIEQSAVTSDQVVRRKRRHEVTEVGTILKHGTKTMDSVITLRVGLPEASIETNEEEVENSRLRKRAIALEARLKEEAEKRSELELSQLQNEIQSEENSDASSEDLSEQDTTQDNRPIFLPRNQRTLCHDQRKEITQPLETLNNTDSIETRRKESKDLLVSVIAEEEEQLRRYLEASQKGGWDPECLPDDDDAVNEEAEYELWKIREMKRILRTREEMNKKQAFLNEIERRRHMTDEERREDDKRLDALKPKREKPSKYKFMQKYYHKGAFFQDKAQTAEEPLYLRDYNVPVGEDNIDKTLLPQPMRLRRDQFGKAGQVKHTHLADVDTTDFTSAWYKPNMPKPFLQSKEARKKSKTSKYDI